MSRPRVGHTLKAYGRYGTVGIELVLCVAVGMWLGSKGDARWGTTPWLTLLGLVGGAYAGFRAIFKAAATLTRDAEEAERADEEDRRG